MGIDTLSGEHRVVAETFSDKIRSRIVQAIGNRAANSGSDLESTDEDCVDNEERKNQ